MDIRGRRIHIAGSASPEADESKLEYAHTLVSQLVAAVASEGAAFIVPFGKEPFLTDPSDGLSIIFDWTVAASVHRALLANRATASSTNGRLITSLATSKTDEQIPATRRPIYDGLRDANAVALEFLDSGWTAGAFRRQRLAQLGDILIGISGGEGVEHLAVEYSAKGKPVIPLDIQLGASQRDGSGGAARLFGRALARPADFFRVNNGCSPGDLLDRTRTRDATVPIPNVVTAIISLLHALTPPPVFYVRLLNDKHADYAKVEAFFRTTVDPFVKNLGYAPVQMGVGKNEFAWMNQAIFDTLHHSAVVLVDLTGLRPNCFMELGYALGNNQRVIVTVCEGTDFPFDAFALEAFRWNESEPPDVCLERLRIHWQRNIDMPSLVKPKEAR